MERVREMERLIAEATAEKQRLLAEVVSNNVYIFLTALYTIIRNIV